MSLTARIAYNTFIQVFGKAGAVLFGVLSIALLTRYLGQTGFGQYTTVIAFVQFFGVLADLGLYMIAVKKISEVRDDTDHVFSNIFTLRLVTALVFVGAAPLVVLFFHYPPIIKWGVAVVTSMNLFVTLNQLLVGLFQRTLSMARAAIGEVTGKAVMLGFVFLFVRQERSLLYVLFAVVLGSFVQFLVSWWFARRLVKLQFRVDLGLWKEVIRESWPIAVTIALNIIYFRADTILLSIFYPASVVGLYGASYKVLEVLIAFPAMFAGLVMPLLTRHYSTGNREAFQAALQKSFDFLAAIALPMVTGGFLLSTAIMQFVAGSTFAESGGILRVLIFATGSIFLGVLFGNTVVAIGQQRSMIRIYFIVAVASVIGYLLLIPPFSVWGASGMTVATELSITLGSLYVVLRTTKVRISLMRFGKALASSVAMGIVLWLLRGQPLLLTVALGMIVYGATMLALGAVQRSLLRDFLRPS